VSSESPPREKNLASTASRALGWSFVNTAVSRFGTLAIGIVLARVLGPEQFGTFAVATVALIAVLSFNELGVSLAVVRWQGDPKLIAPTVTTISVASSALLTLAVYLSAPTFSAAMGDPGATGVVRLMGISILVNGAVATPAALLQRNFRQGRRMAIDQVNTWLGAILSLVLALTGWGAMSLAIGRVAGSLVSGFLFVRWSPLPYRFGFERSVARGLLRFGLPLAGASVVVFASSYADQLTAGSLLGAKALGFYVLAFNLSSWPVSIFSQPLRSVAPAALSRLQHDPESMNRAFRSTLRLLAIVALPTCLVLAGAARPIVSVVYGPVWAPAAPVLSFLGVMAAARILFELGYDYLVVRGRSQAILGLQVGWLAVLVPALILGARLGGLRGVAAAQVLVAVVVIAPLYGVLLSRSGVQVGPLVRAIAVPVCVGTALAAAAWTVALLSSSDVLSCVLAGVLGLTAVAGLLFRSRSTLTEVRAVRGMRPDG
jgi:O-antigen/teichoic acid export membrane protein